MRGNDDMALRPAQVLIYHITDVENLPDILRDGGLHSDAVMAQRDYYGHWLRPYQRATTQ